MNIIPPSGWSTRVRFPRTVSTTLLVVFVVTSLAIGFALGNSSRRLGNVTNINEPAPAYLSKNVDFSLFWKVWNYIHATALEQPVPDTKLFYGALQGMVAGLGDPYTVFFDPDSAKQFNQELSGTFEGIGAEIGLKDNKLTIIAPLPSTPAERTGLKAGDRILAIDNKDTTGISVDNAVSLIRGKRGTKVKLLVQTNDKQPREVEITRERIEVPIVKGSLKDLPGGQGKVAYIQIVQFAEDADDLFLAKWLELAGQGPKGIIIDLRNNPGGYLDQAVDLSSHWLGRGKLVVKEVGAPADTQDYISTGQGELAQYKTIILVNQGSASASEIMSGALQDWKLATVVGEPTFGKGSVQTVEDFEDGSAVKVTIAKWYTPKGRTIDKTGLEPDIIVKKTTEDEDKDKDPQLEKALELLSK